MQYVSMLLGSIARLWNRGCLGKAIVAFGALILLGLCSSALGLRGGSMAAVGNVATTAPVAVAQRTTALGPTERPPPTRTPAPTEPPTAIPTATPLPEPVMLQGHGKSVTDPFALPAPLSRVSFTHTGRRNFIVTAYTKDGKEQLLANTIGAYTGERLLAGTEPFYLEINADGDWTATVAALGQNDDYARGANGTGDWVSDLFAPPSQGAVPFAFSHTGARNFIVEVHCANSDHLVANEIGQTTGEVVVRFGRGPCIWDVQADGAWTIKPK